MAHPDPNRGGSEQGQRQHAGRTSEASDAGMQTHSQGARGKGPSVIGETQSEAARETSEHMTRTRADASAGEASASKPAGSAGSSTPQRSGASQASSDQGMAPLRGKTSELARGGDEPQRESKTDR